MFAPSVNLHSYVKLAAPINENTPKTSGIRLFGINARIMKKKTVGAASFTPAAPINENTPKTAKGARGPVDRRGRSRLTARPDLELLSSLSLGANSDTAPHHAHTVLYLCPQRGSLACLLAAYSL
ncbi:hypothetical protein J6590_041312 [Homalodisca vitripennis]|nr:hypothetical protein J6590_041312 [Homalodisca vitripennis]